MSELLIFLPLLIFLGAVSGFAAGMLGIGGGIILVPGLYYIFSSLGYPPEHLMHVAVGTSLAVIVPTGFVSARAHAKKNSVRFDLVKKIGIGIVLGVGIGTLAANQISGDALKLFFACALLVLAFFMQLDPDKWQYRGAIPPQPWPGMVGVVMGAIATLMGIGGATMNVPYMTLHGVPMRQAIGSTAAMGVLVAVPGALGFLWIGWGEAAVPPFTLGYINLLASAVLIPFSVICAPYGAQAAHCVPVRNLRLIFSAFMVCVALHMGYGAIFE